MKLGFSASAVEGRGKRDEVKHGSLTASQQHPWFYCPDRRKRKSTRFTSSLCQTGRGPNFQMVCAAHSYRLNEIAM